MNENKNRGQRDSNPDPITGAPGAHPVGTGIGGAAGAAAGVAGAMAVGAAAGTVVGPIGTVLGGAAGAIIGGLMGKGVAEQVNPTEEEAYWKDNYRNEPYYQENHTWDDYDQGYRVGYEGYGKYGQKRASFDNYEAEFRQDYEKNRGNSKLTWDQARLAARAAWDRHDRSNLERYIGYSVVDHNDQNIGTLDCLWAGSDGQPEFVGVKTGWLFGKTHVVPADKVHVNEARQVVRLPYDLDRVKGAPTLDADSDVTDDMQREAYSYYGINRGSKGGGYGSTAPQTQTRDMPRETTQAPNTPRQAATNTPGRATPEQATIQLSEEKVKAGKREVEAGGVRLRKIFRTEPVNQPVELRREEIVERAPASEAHTGRQERATAPALGPCVERVPASEAHTGRQKAFNDQEVYIPLRREEAVIEKDQAARRSPRAKAD